MANDSDMRSLLTMSSSIDGSTSPQVRKWRNIPLHERCSMSDMVKIKEVFETTYGNKLLQNEFRTLLKTLLNVEYDDEEFKILFMKINTSRDGEINWDQLVSHLLLGYFASDQEDQGESLQLPIMGLPKIMRSQHRHPISRICFCPDVAKDRSTDPMQGCYITASRDGMISWWSLDMVRLRSAHSTCPALKVRTTWVTDLACLPDVNIVVTSSTERDLRFYDCSAGTFTLKIIISSWEYMISTMYYHFDKDEREDCLLVCGDVGGYVRVLRFSPVMRGPFRNQPGRALQQLRHVDLQKRPELLPELQLVEFPRAHTDWVRQVSYYASLHCVVSCATCPDALLMCDLAASRTHNTFHTEKGIQCFAFEEEAHVLVTGGPDCCVRVWNSFVATAPSALLQGHRAGIIALVLQDRARRAYSLARDRTIKVWDLQAQACLQTYIDVPPQIGERTPISAVYNPATRELLLAAVKLAVLVLDEQLNPLHTDGFTHSRAVSKLLYNPLFKVIITCGMDSIIINWDPLTGKRNVVMRSAHTRLLHGELVPVEITAACFDPANQLLLTGARDGTLKTWNFNTGVSLRYLEIEHMCEVTSCFWIEGRILAVGWNRHVTEFEDQGLATQGKSWETRHRDDVLAAAVRVPLTIATASYASELLLWKLETGQPYRRFSCTEPTLRIKMQYSKRTASPQQPAAAAAAPHAHRPSAIFRPSVSGIRSGRARRVSTVALPAQAQVLRQLAVHAMIFLETRPMSMHVASMMLSLENGQVQCWSDHPAGGYKGSFQGIHTAGDYVSAFATDVGNEFLFTGTTVGYIKVWLMTNYLTTEKVHVNMPRLRMEFPFLWRDRIEGRAKRCVRDQPLPLLLNSYRAHLRCVTSLAYIDDQKLLLSMMWRRCVCACVSAAAARTTACACGG
ncbi:PREDICTED: WD repeat-containing protein on Y chromosome-like isoform X2 [Papilio xuthus]|uniref:WD repeat-containing protein on Y chromosome n=1 Tax=Papilio xuthus TaxID=66420 RepID=A0AAJ6ZSC7_PAPXU|nr:PREDICTED: WD repeat-containing protein on Y chromosome-like isoform X2 [Papilio xuthus]